MAALITTTPHISHISHIRCLKKTPNLHETLNTKHKFPDTKAGNFPPVLRLVSGLRACRNDFCRSVNCRNDDIHCRRHTRKTPILNPDTISHGTIPIPIGFPIERTYRYLGRNGGHHRAHISRKGSKKIGPTKGYRLGWVYEG